MGLLEKLKSLIGANEDRQSPASGGSESDVTVEHEPSAESEHAVKGTDPSRAEQTATEPTTAGAESTTGTAESPSVEEIKGIGPTYANRLEAAGIETVADIAAADVAEVADAAQAGEGRVSDWVERARNF